MGLPVGIYYRGLRRPLYRQSQQRLPFMFAVLTESFQHPWHCTVPEDVSHREG